MKKKISKMLAMIMVLNMILGVNMVSDVYASIVCPICGGTSFKDPVSENIKNMHYCHRDNIWHQNNCISLNEAHDFNTTCPSNGNHEWAGQSYTSTCCCGIHNDGNNGGTDIDLINSSLNVKYDSLDKANGTDYFADETTNNWNAGNITEETRVTVDRASYFTITIPKEIVLNGDNGTATYEVSATGEIAGDQILKVVPIADEVASRTFKLNEDGGKQVDVTVTQANTDFTYQNLDNRDVYNGTLSAPNISAGNWSGKFDFNITFTNN